MVGWEVPHLVYSSSLRSREHFLPIISGASELDLPRISNCSAIGIREFDSILHEIDVRKVNKSNERRVCMQSLRAGSSD